MIPVLKGIGLIVLGTIAISSTHKPPYLVISVPPLVSALASNSKSLINYSTAQAPHLSRLIFCVAKHSILSGLFGITPLQGQTVLPRVHAPYLHAFFAFALTTWIPKTIPLNHFQQNPLIVSQTSFVYESRPNHNFMGDPHRRCQLCAPRTSLKGRLAHGLTTYF